MAKTPVPNTTPPKTKVPNTTPPKSPEPGYSLKEKVMVGINS